MFSYFEARLKKDMPLFLFSECRHKGLFKKDSAFQFLFLGFKKCISWKLASLTRQRASIQKNESVLAVKVHIL